MITIYHLGASQSERIVWLMEELALPYRLEWFDRTPARLAPPEYLALHPVATAPTIRDGDVVLCESVAIVEYIIHRHGGGRLGIPAHSPHYPDYLYWMRFSTSLMATLDQLRMCPPRANDDGETVYLQAAKRRLPRYLDHLEQRLGASKFLAGPEFSGVDIQNVFTLARTLPKFVGAANVPPRIADYVDRLSRRPAYVKAMAIAGPAATRPESIVFGLQH